MHYNKGRHKPYNSIQVLGPVLRVVQGHLGPLPLDLEVVVSCLEGLPSVGPLNWTTWSSTRWTFRGTKISRALYLSEKSFIASA